MTPYEAYQIEQERTEQQDAAREERRIEGITDGAFGYLPSFADEDYLSGYVEGIRQLPRDRSGKILYGNPRRISNEQV